MRVCARPWNYVCPQSPKEESWSFRITTLETDVLSPYARHESIPDDKDVCGVKCTRVRDISDVPLHRLTFFSLTLVRPALFLPKERLRITMGGESESRATVDVSVGIVHVLNERSAELTTERKNIRVHRFPILQGVRSCAHVASLRASLRNSIRDHTVDDHLSTIAARDFSPSTHARVCIYIYNSPTELPVPVARCVDRHASRDEIFDSTARTKPLIRESS